MDVPGLVEALTGGAAVGLIALAREYLRYRAKRVEEKVPGVIAAVADIYHVMGGVLATTHASRVLILKVTNGGDVPMVGSNLHGSVVYEVANDMPLIGDRWRKQPLDRPYIDLMRRVYEEGEATVITRQMPNSHLKDVYLNDGVQQSNVHFIYATEGAFYAMSVTFPERVPYDAFYRNTLRIAKKQIQHHFKTFPPP